MKIGPLESPPVGLAAAERKGHPSPAPGRTEPSAQVDLSPAAAGLVGAGADASFDAAKVARIAGAIRDGRFVVDPEAIADKLIVNAEELLGRKLS